MPNPTPAESNEIFAAYAHPEVLVSTDWLSGHLDDPNVVVLESDEDLLLYELGHIPGAQKLDWETQMQQPVIRDFVDKAGFEKLASERGISNDSTIVFYGDRSNWYATYGFWLFKYYGHKDVRVLNGGRATWELERRPMTREVPSVSPTNYVASEPDASIRAFRGDVAEFLKTDAPALVDVRSNPEYTGELLHAIGYPQEGAQRAGHIKGAVNIPWGSAANEDGTFKAADDLKKIYTEKGISPDKPTIAYCRIGERSSHTWFVLTYLLGHSNVRNYDGSWTEWGSLVGAPNAIGNEPG